MKLQDINQALTNITRIHEGLTEDKLRLLLSAAGWEKNDVADAIQMWKNGEIGKEITEKIETLPVNTQETQAVVPKIDKNLSNEVLPPPVVPAVTHGVVEANPNVTSTTENEPVSQVAKVNIEEKKTEKNGLPSDSFDDHLPHNLPLRPYESSFVTVPFSDYKKRFVPPVSEPSSVSGVKSPENIKQGVQSAPLDVSKPSFEEEKMGAPLHTEDKLLVFIAIVLFLVLMVLLGYMYTNGRL